MATKIKAMESKLLAGSIDRTDETKAALEKKKQEVIEQRVCSILCTYLDYVNVCLFVSVVSEKFGSNLSRKKRVLLRSRRPLRH